MESSKVCLLLIALGATLAAVAAEPAPMHYYKTPTWWWKPPPVYNAPLYLKSTGFATNLPDPEVCTLGASAYFQVDLTCVVNGQEGAAPIGIGYYSGIYVKVNTADPPSKTNSSTGDSGCLMNYQLSFILNSPCGSYPAGKIFLLGDGTGVQDAIFSNKAIVGGDGWYVGKLGLMTKTDKIYTLTFSKMGA